MNPFNFSMLILVITVTTVLCAAIYDYRSRLIPNVITFAAMLTGLGLHSIHAGWSGLWFSLGGLALGGGIRMTKGSPPRSPREPGFAGTPPSFGAKALPFSQSS